jgi:hypothetical protein
MITTTGLIFPNHPSSLIQGKEMSPVHAQLVVQGKETHSPVYVTVHIIAVL